MALTELVTTGLIVAWWLSAAVGLMALGLTLYIQWRRTNLIFRDDYAWTFMVSLFVWAVLSMVLYNLPGGGA